ncbi:hypothetical protein ACIHEJ_35375 [Streptomyces sp. NPDC052301]|uniref:hypothetical protein n=1 Tax=Streptomyces sp. NPDC052301 TaxID=3365687 RepID=UPI0037D3083C
MKLKTGRAAYYKSSDTASQQTRQLGIAGLAVVWLLAGGLQKSAIHLSETLLVSGIALVSALSLDLLQYARTTATFAIWVRYKEKKQRGGIPNKDVDEDDIGDAPAAILPIMWVCFYAKLVAIGVAYGEIFSEMSLDFRSLRLQ